MPLAKSKEKWAPNTKQIATVVTEREKTPANLSFEFKGEMSTEKSNASFLPHGLPKWYEHQCILMC